MKINDIITLTQAGWTKDEIMLLANTEPKPEPKPDDKPKPDPKPDDKPNPEQKPDPKPDDKPEQPDDRLSKLETKLDYVINRFNLLAVKGSQQPNGKDETLDDILSSVVRGFQKEEKK